MYHMNNIEEDDIGMMTRMRLWDKKLSHLDSEMLVYIQQRAYLILESREKKVNDINE